MTKLTINDIAKLIGVGKSTVSRVLNNDSNVSKETRKRVEAVIAQYGFQPSKSARAMRGVGNRTVGIILSRLSSDSENQALAAMLPLLYANQCEPIIMESQFNPQLVREHLDFFVQRGVDGVILFAFSELKESQIQDWRHKMVVIARQYKSISSVYYDDDRAIELLMTHLYGQGYRSITYLGVEDKDTTTGFNRHRAYQQFCQRNQLIPRSIQGSLDYS
ncbi:MAG TPA: HTH-type transcriptional regulator TreR, partial [Pasteurellaceae bacterium]|nr:HTH-type transcriptional regulator TreR [Pasteurellaceae bacterium]